MLDHHRIAVIHQANGQLLNKKVKNFNYFDFFCKIPFSETEFYYIINVASVPFGIRILRKEW